MEFKNNTKKIKEALLQGGLVVSDRCTGKTLALAEILLEDEDAVVITPTAQQSETIKLFLLENGLSHEEVKERIIPAQRAEKYLIGERSNKNVYVDEWDINPYRGYFKAAVTSFQFPIKVIK